MAFFARSGLTFTPDYFTMAEADLERPLQVAVQERCDYAEVRLVTERVRVVRLRSSGLEVSDTTLYGAGVRVLKRGGWGFAATSDVSWAGLDEVARTAAGHAAASTMLAEGSAVLPPAAPTGLSGAWHHGVKRHPLEADLKGLGRSLTELDSALRTAAGVGQTAVGLHVRERTQVLVTSADSRVEQQWLDTALRLELGIAGSEAPIVGRSRRVHALGGLEVLDQLDAVTEAEALAETTAARAAASETYRGAAHAPPAPIGNVLMSPAGVAVLLHASLAHRPWFVGTTGEEAGGMAMGLFGALELASDPTLASGLATYGYDDVGQQAARWTLVDAGRPTTAAPEQWPAWRAAGFVHSPTQRLSNLVVGPGADSVAAMQQSAQSGLWVDRPQRWSIDAGRRVLWVSFDDARAIENGTPGPRYRSAELALGLETLWGACRAFGGPSSVEDVPMGCCLAGEPPQGLPMTHRVPAAWFVFGDDA